MLISPRKIDYGKGGFCESAFGNLLRLISFPAYITWRRFYIF